MKNRSNRRVRPLMLVSAAGLIALPTAALAQPFSWATAVSGAWFDSTKWSPASVPNASSAAVTLGLSGAYTSSLQNNSVTVGTLTISNPNAVLSLFDNDFMTVSGGAVSNAGLIQISDPSAPGNTTRMIFTAPSTISGAGTLRLAAVGNGDNGSAYIDDGGAANVLTNSAGHTIAGKGRVYAALTNNGTVTADQSGAMLVLLTQPKTNNATMQATNDAGLILRCAVTQGASGVLKSIGANSYVLLQGASVNGGSLAAGTLYSAYGTSNSVDNFTVSPGTLLQISDNSVLTVSSNILNNGTLAVSTVGAPGNTTRLVMGAPAAFTGNGLIRIQAVNDGDNGSAYLDYAAAANILTNTSTHTIAGDGRIYCGLVNAGTVNADQNGKLLVLLDQNKSNSGVMKATGGGALYLRTALTQTGSGNVQADGASTVVLQSASISGGSMSTGLLQTAYGTVNTLDSFTIAAPATLQINDNSSVNVSGANLVNNGLIAVDTVGAPGNSALIRVAQPALSLTGTGTLRMQAVSNFSDTAYLYYTVPGNILTQAAGHTIAGVGRIYTNLVNNGTVVADSNASNRTVLQLLDQPKTNNNIMRATNGGSIYISNITVAQAAAATIQADTNSSVVLQGAGITSGRLTTAGTGQVATIYGTTNVIDGVTLTSGTQLIVNDNTTLLTRTSLVDNGTITLQTIGAPGNTARLMCDSPAVSISGTGTILMQATGNFNDTSYIWQNSFGSPSVPGVYTQAAGHSIVGNGRIYNGLINNGTVLANVGTSGREVLQLLDQPKTNNSLMKATGGGQIYISGTSIGQGPSGQIVADPGSTVVLQSAAVSGGTLSSSGSGLFQTVYGTTSTLDSLSLASGSQLVLNDNTTLNLGTNGIVNNGAITVDTIGAPGNTARLLAPSNAAVSGTGTVRLQATGYSNDTSYIWGQGDGAHPLTLGPGQTLTGTGRLYGNIVSQGTISPDQPFGTPAVAGNINIGGSSSLTMSATSAFNVQALSGSNYDSINGSGTVAQAGSLTVTTSGGYVPAAHDMLTVVSGSSLSGTFSHVSLPTVGAFGPAHVVYGPTDTKVVMCYANCDGSTTAPALNVLDFACYLNLYASGDTQANCDGSTTPPVLNVLDFACFLNKYAAGCP